MEENGITTTQSTVNYAKQYFVVILK